MVTSLIGQLIGLSSPATRGTLIVYLQKYIRTHQTPFQAAEHVPDEEKLWELLRAMTKISDKPVVVLLDALDECMKADATSVAQNIQHPDLEMVRFFLTGRPLVRPIFRNIPISVVAMDVRDDIDRFITEKLEEEKYGSLRAHRDSIIRTICQNSDGMFRYAGTISPHWCLVPRY